MILGAAVGEVALGRKIGNRAMVWGAIGGTIPDLDVLSGPFISDIEALGFHRGITHSILFSVLAPLLLAWIVQGIYSTGTYKHKPYKVFVSVLNILLLVAVTAGINMAFWSNPTARWWVLSLTLPLALYLLWRLYSYYWKRDPGPVHTTYKQWYWLFFLALTTHWLLDCFTAYGTQIFQPFSDYRVAFDNIAVVDPLYTIPFLICLIIASKLKRNTRGRNIANWLGIGISSTYMLLTLFNKMHIDSVFEKAMANRNISIERYRTTPTIFNNLLWVCTAEGANEFYSGQYSIFDSDPNLHYLSVIPKQDSIHQLLKDEPEYQTLQWFSNDYLVAFPTDSVIYLCDLRFGGMGDTIRDQRDLVFSFRAVKDSTGYTFTEHREPFPEDVGLTFQQFFTRMFGY
jgi:inner membrane protein